MIRLDFLLVGRNFEPEVRINITIGINDSKIPIVPIIEELNVSWSK